MFKYLLLTTFSLLILVSSAFAVPDLQLFIDGATYDWYTQTWVAESNSIDLYVISANDAKDDIIVSLAMDGGGLPSSMGVTFDGTAIDPGAWVYDYSPLASAPGWDGGVDLPPHGVFPTWFTEVHTGAYGLGSSIGDVQPELGSGEYWDPSPTPEFPGAPANQQGEWKMFTVDVSGPVGTGIHFDAYTMNGTAIDNFAPFSHDAGTTIVPEPGTIILMGSGLMGMGFGVFRRRKKK